MPSQKIKKKLNLELVSMLFKKKIVIYYISEEFFLNAILVNNNFEKKIEILRIGNNHYDTVHSKQQMQNIKQTQNLIYEVKLINKTLINKIIKKLLH